MNLFHRQPTGGFTGNQYKTIRYTRPMNQQAGLSLFQIGDCPLLFFFSIKCITDIWALQQTYVILPVHVRLN